MSTTARQGTVYLVGAGPGDGGLVTRRALELVRSADVLLVDRLIPQDLVREARADARIVDVGKNAGNHAMPQDEINEQLVREAVNGRSVVRVKGGDPYLFGRGGEEAMYCRAAGVPFEVVPAVTSAFAACADAGIPVTHRDVSRHVTVVTASAGRDGKGDPDYEWLAKSDGTIVLLMGLRRVGHVADQLIEAGMDRHRPAAVISRGTTLEQRTVTGTIGTIERQVQGSDLPSPAIIVVGEVIALREHLDWFEQRPLFGTRVAVTRARAQSSELVAQLTALGAQVTEVPSIRIEPLPTAPLDRLIDGLADIDMLVFTSANGVRIFFEQLVARGKDARALGAARVACVGTATADACAGFGVRADVVPPAGKRTGLGLVETLGSEPVFGTRCAMVRAETGDERVVSGLEQLGMTVELVHAYRTVVDPASEAEREALLASDVVTFTSASTVHNTVAMLRDGDVMPAAVTIGPVTTEAALDAGVRVLAEAATTDIESLVESLVDRAADNARCSPWRHAAASAPLTR